MNNSQATSYKTTTEIQVENGTLSKLIDTSSLQMDPDFEPIFTAVYKDYVIYQTSSVDISLYHSKSNKTVSFTLSHPLLDFLIFSRNGNGSFYIIILAENSTLLIFKVIHPDTSSDELSVKLVKEKQLGSEEPSGYFGLSLLREGFIIFAKKEFTICSLTESSFKAKTKTLPEVSVGDFDITSYAVNKEGNEIVVYLSKKDEIKIMLLVMSDNNKLSKLDFMDIESAKNIKLHEPKDFLNIGLAEFTEEKAKLCYLYLVSVQGDELKNIKLQKFKIVARKRPKGRTKRVLCFESEKILELDDNYVCSISNNKCLLWGYHDILIYQLRSDESEFDSCKTIKFSDIDFDGKKNAVDLSFDWAEYTDDGCLLVRNSQLIGKVSFEQKNEIDKVSKSNKVIVNPKPKKAEKIVKDVENDDLKKKKKIVGKNKTETLPKKVTFSEKETAKPKVKLVENKENKEIKGNGHNKEKVAAKNSGSTTANKLIPPKTSKTTKSTKKLPEEKKDNSLNISIDSVLGKVRKQQEDLKAIEEQLQQLLLKK